MTGSSVPPLTSKLLKLVRYDNEAVEMGRKERIEIAHPCPRTPSLKRSLEPQGIKKSLNLNFRPNPMLVAVSLLILSIPFLFIILNISGLTEFWIFNSALLLVFSCVEVIILGAGWKLTSEIIEFSKAKSTSTLVGEERIVE